VLPVPKVHKAIWTGMYLDTGRQGLPVSVFDEPNSFEKQKGGRDIGDACSNAPAVFCF